jgi:beta-glucosidase
LEVNRITANFPKDDKFGLTSQIRRSVVSVPSNIMVTVSVTVANTGKAAGKEVVQVYFSAPDGRLEKPARELAAYAKTDLLQPGQSQKLTISYKTNDMSSYDEQKAACILEPGSYKIYAGNSIKNIKEAGSYNVSSEKITEQLTNQVGLPANYRMTLLSRKDPKGTFPTTPPIKAEPTASGPGQGAGNDSITATKSPGEAKIKLKDVYEGRSAMKDFIAQFTDSELINLIVGLGKDYSQPVFGAPSNVPAASKEKVVDLNRLGIPAITLSDGPAGIGSNGPNTAFPVATLVACTWNEELAGELGRAVGKEDVHFDTKDPIFKYGFGLSYNYSERHK